MLKGEGTIIFFFHSTALLVQNICARTILFQTPSQSFYSLSLSLSPIQLKSTSPPKRHNRSPVTHHAPSIIHTTNTQRHGITLREHEAQVNCYQSKKRYMTPYVSGDLNPFRHLQSMMKQLVPSNPTYYHSPLTFSCSQKDRQRDRPRTNRCDYTATLY